MILSQLPLPRFLKAVLLEPGFLKAIYLRLKLQTVPLLKPGHEVIQPAALEVIQYSATSNQYSANSNQ